MKPSTLQIAEAFKEDAVPIVKQEIRKVKAEIAKIDKHYEGYHDKAGLIPDEFSGIYWNKVITMLKPKAPYATLKRLQTMLFLMAKPAKGTNKGAEAYQDMAYAIERAKMRDIKDLYPFERLRQNYTRWVACCPLHGEKTPSFTIYTKNNSWYCFGCGEGGNTIDFIMKLKGCDFKEAVEVLG